MDRNLSEDIQNEGEIYRNIFENMLEVLYRSDLEERIVLISPSAVKMFGYDGLKDFIGKKIPETFYYNPEDRSLLLDELSRHEKVAAIAFRRGDLPLGQDRFPKPAPFNSGDLIKRFNVIIDYTVFYCFKIINRN